MGRDSLLIVHLLGHGAEDGQGGLLLSDSAQTGSSRLYSCFNLDSLRHLLTAVARWAGCNILVVCDFCCSGALLKPEHDLCQASTVARLGFSRQMIASTMPDTSSYMGCAKTVEPDGSRTGKEVEEEEYNPFIQEAKK